MRKLLILSGLIFFINGCDSPTDYNREGDKLDGWVSYVDSNLILAGGFYSVSVYSADSTSPFNRIPFRTDSLLLYKRDNIYESMYSIEGVPEGRFYVAATWSRFPRIQNEVPMVLGTYGCDTSINCASHTVILYPNYQGNFRNIVSWTDTLKRLN